jgi:nicotinamidase-related amidase
VTGSWVANDTAHLGARLTRGVNPCVLVVDLANAFTSRDHPLGGDLDTVVAMTRSLLDRARDRDVPVIFTTIAFRDDLSDAGIWPQKAPRLADLVTGSPLVAVDERLDRRDNEPIIEKQGTSALFGTELITLLVRLHVDSVVVCGASTSGCIRATAVDCLQYGLPVFIPRECVGDRSEEAHEANLRDLDAKYADVTTHAEILAYFDEVGASDGATVGGSA